MLGEGQVEALAPDRDQVGLVARPDPGPGDLDRVLAVAEADRDQLVEVLGARVLRLDQLDPAFLRHLRRVDEVDLLLGVAREDHRRGRRFRAGACRRRRSGRGIRPRPDRPSPVPRPCASRPSFSQSGTNGASASISSGRTAAMLTALVTTPPVSAAVTCSAVTMPARSWASAVEAPRCGVTTTSSRAKIGCSVKGSEGKTSSAAPPSLPLSRPARTGVELDQLAAGAVDDAGAVLHRGDRVGVDQADRLRRLRRVQGDHVGPAEQLLQRLRALYPELLEALGGDELVEGDDVHLEALRALGDELADPAEADHAERLAVELGALELRPLPLAGGQRGVRLRHIAAERQHQRQGVLGGGDGVRFGRVGDDHAALGRGRDVYVVDPGAGAADHLQAASPGRSTRRSSGSPSGSGSRRTRRSPRLSSSSDISSPRSTSKFSRSSSTPVSAIFSLTRTFTGSSPRRSRSPNRRRR